MFFTFYYSYKFQNDAKSNELLFFVKSCFIKLKNFTLQTEFFTLFQKTKLLSMASLAFFKCLNESLKVVVQRAP